MTTESSKANGKPTINTDSHLSDADRSFLAQAAYQKSTSVKVAENSGDWTIVGEPKELTNGLEIYAFKQKDSNEVVFAVRGTDNEPSFKEDLGLNGADWAFSGKLHPQMEEAIRFVHEFVNDRDNIRENYTYSTTGHSKGGGIICDCFLT